MDCIKDHILERCSHTYAPGPRKGRCCECLRHHLAKRQLPACCFPEEAEATWNRSFEHFAQLVGSEKV